jgi:quinol monooxygenase YgiN
MTRFAQHTRLVAHPGKRDELVAKFLLAADIQAANAACELMLVSTDADAADVVYLTEVWTTREDWERATRSDEIAAWAAPMPGLVAEAPHSTELKLAGGKGVGRS